MDVTGIAEPSAPRPWLSAADRIGTLALVLLAFGIGGLAAAAGLTWQHVSAATEVATFARQRAIADTERTALAIDGLLRQVMPLARDAAGRLGRPGQREADVVAQLTELAGANRAVRGVGAAYAPFAFSSDRRLFAPYVLNTGPGTTRRTQVEAAYDYTGFEHRWYGDSILDGAMWHGPLEGMASEGQLALRAEPFFREGADRAAEAPMGVLFATVSLDDIARQLDSMALGINGYAFVFSSQGNYVAHPRRDLVTQGATVFETAWNSSNTSLHSAAIHALKGESGFVESIDPTTGHESWFVHAPIKATGWTLAVVYYEEAFRLNPDRDRRDSFRIAAAAMIGVGLIGLALFVVLVDGRSRWMWALATSVSVSLGIAIGVLWSVSSRFPAEESGDRVRVLDMTETEQFLRTYERSSGRRLERIRTGAFVKSIEFLSSTNVQVTGQVWQRFRAPAPAAPEFVLADADKPEVLEVSRHREGADEVVLWSFAATLRDNFSYEKYPFDRQSVAVRLRPASIGRSEVLVPDFAAYAVSNPAARPGLASDLVLPGWELSASYFDYRPAGYTANFGFEGLDATTAPPELSFNVIVSRRFLGPFVANIVPLGVAGVMIFCLLIISSKEERLSRFAGFTAKDIIKGAAAVFFVISFQHIALRNALASPRLIYFEYFYFTTYLGLLAVVLNGILFATGHGGRMIEFRDNLLPKIAFWPTIMTCLFIITLMVFY